MTPKTETFLFPAEAELSTLLADLPAPLCFHDGIETAATLTLCDTFDWRLFKKGMVLTFDGKALQLCDVQLSPKAPAITATLPRFVEDLPDVLANQLASILEMRALLPLAEVTFTRSAGKIVDDEGKAQVWLDITSSSVGEKKGPLGINVRGMRGYDDTYQIACDHLQGHAKAAKKPLLHTLYKKAQLKPLGYSGKMNLKLDGEAPAHEATRVIYRRLLQIIEQNLDGLHKDIDTEFLHDFRVAVRRTRSGLSQIKGVFHPDVVAKAKVDFALLGKWTNRLRDLDVYLLARDDYMALVPEEMQDDLQLFFDHLAQERGDALRELLQNLNSEQFQAILDTWRDLLEQPETAAEAPDAELPILELAGKRIYKKYKQIRTAGLAIHEGVPDQDIHDLRIECKKLRYLLEFFSSLYPSEFSSDLIRRLKHLQTVLGDFNDLYVQGMFIGHMSTEIKPPARRLRPAILALGALMGNLHIRQRDLKSVCIARVGEFLQEETHQRFLVFKKGLSQKPKNQEET